MSLNHYKGLNCLCSPDRSFNKNKKEPCKALNMKDGGGTGDGGGPVCDTYPQAKNTVKATCWEAVIACYFLMWLSLLLLRYWCCLFSPAVSCDSSGLDLCTSTLSTILHKHFNVAKKLVYDILSTLSITTSKMGVLIPLYKMTSRLATWFKQIQKDQLEHSFFVLNLCYSKQFSVLFNCTIPEHFPVVC